MMVVLLLAVGAFILLGICCSMRVVRRLRQPQTQIVQPLPAAVRSSTPPDAGPVAGPWKPPPKKWVSPFEDGHRPSAPATIPKKSEDAHSEIPVQTPRKLAWLQ